MFGYNKLCYSKFLVQVILLRRAKEYFFPENERKYKELVKINTQNAIHLWLLSFKQEFYVSIFASWLRVLLLLIELKSKTRTYYLIAQFILLFDFSSNEIPFSNWITVAIQTNGIDYLKVVFFSLLQLKLNLNVHVHAGCSVLLEISLFSCLFLPN